MLDEKDGSDADKLLNNILPSYHMFQSTISKTLSTSREDYLTDPPIYEVTPVHSNVSTPALSVLPSPVNELTNVNSFPFIEAPEEQTFDDDCIDIWENTILANVHRLKNLTNSKSLISKDLQVEIFVTKDVVQKGMKPSIIDPHEREYQQGDYIHGFVTIKNNSSVPIPFDMVYVVFEGIVTIYDNKGGMIDVRKPLKVEKYLNMLDLFASWSYANIDRLVTDHGDPHDWCDDETDPYDNARLSIDAKRLFQPNVTYKRYFTFKIPEVLLDDICEYHGLALHTQVPPTLGKLRRVDTTQLGDSSIKDLCFIDACLSYTVEARVIGRSSDFCKSDSKDHYVVAKESICPIRVIPNTKLEHIYNTRTMNHEISIFYAAFESTVREKLEEAEHLSTASMGERREFLLSPQTSRESSSIKLNQLYTQINSKFEKTTSDSKSFQEQNYQFISPIKKRSLTASKDIGFISLSTPKHDYRTSYIPPPKYRKGELKDKETQLTIPIDLTYFYRINSLKQPSMPKIKSITAELTALTIKSDKYPIPVEFNHEMCFRDKEVVKNLKQVVDNFDRIVIQPNKKNLQKLTYHLKHLGSDVFKVETKLFNDLKSLAFLSTKYQTLVISDLNFSSTTEKSLVTSIEDITWQKEPTESTEYETYSKKFNVHIDLKRAKLKGSNNENSELLFDNYTLVPSFQLCFLSRLYYIKIMVHLHSGEILQIPAPLHIDKLIATL